MTFELLRAIDVPVAQAMFAMRNMELVQAFIWISELGASKTILGLTGIIVLLLLYRRKWSYAAGILVSVLGTTAAVTLLKDAFQRPRMGIDMAAYIETSFSFPSGHAALSLALYGFLIWVTLRTVRNVPRKRIILAFLISLLVAIGFSRLYLGLHYASDVAGAYVIASVFLIVGIRFARALEKRRTSLPELSS